MKEQFKNQKFVFFDIVSKDTPETQITGSEVADLIVAQQIGIDSHIVKATQDIEVIDFAYSDAKPNHWIVFAKWKIV